MKRLIYIACLLTSWTSYGEEKFKNPIQEVKYGEKSQEDLVRLRDGTNLFGFFENLPSLYYSFGKVNLHLKDVAVISFCSDILDNKVQYATRDDHCFISSLPKETLIFWENKSTSSTPKLVKKELNPSQISYIILKSRDRESFHTDRKPYQLNLKDGTQLIVTLNTDFIAVSDGLKTRNIPSESISRLAFDGGLYGEIVENGETKKLDFSYANDKYISVQICHTCDVVKFPWEKVAGIREAKTKHMLSRHDNKSEKTVSPRVDKIGSSAGVSIEVPASSNSDSYVLSLSELNESILSTQLEIKNDTNAAADDEIHDLESLLLTSSPSPPEEQNLGPSSIAVQVSYKEPSSLFFQNDHFEPFKDIVFEEKEEMYHPGSEDIRRMSNARVFESLKNNNVALAKLTLSLDEEELDGEDPDTDGMAFITEGREQEMSQPMEIERLLALQNTSPLSSQNQIPFQDPFRAEGFDSQNPPYIFGQQEFDPQNSHYSFEQPGFDSQDHFQPFGQQEFASQGYVQQFGQQEFDPQNPHYSFEQTGFDSQNHGQLFGQQKFDSQGYGQQFGQTNFDQQKSHDSFEQSGFDSQVQGQPFSQIGFDATQDYGQSFGQSQFDSQGYGQQFGQANFDQQNSHYSFEQPGFDSQGHQYSFGQTDFNSPDPQRPFDQIGFDAQGPGGYFGQIGFDAQSHGQPFGQQGFDLQGPQHPFDQVGFDAQGSGGLFGQIGFDAQSHGQPFVQQGFDLQGPQHPFDQIGFEAHGPGGPFGQIGFDMQDHGQSFVQQGFDLQDPQHPFDQIGFEVHGPGGPFGQIGFDAQSHGQPFVQQGFDLQGSQHPFDQIGFEAQSPGGPFAQIGFEMQDHGQSFGQQGFNNLQSPQPSFRQEFDSLSHQQPFAQQGFDSQNYSHELDSDKANHPFSNPDNNNHLINDHYFPREVAFEQPWPQSRSSNLNQGPAQIDGMVYIPYGQNKTGADTRGFYISPTPISNEEYMKFINATKYRCPQHWAQGKIPKGIEKDPVVNISYTDALTYAIWAEKRLPSEKEIHAQNKVNFLPKNKAFNEWTSTASYQKNAKEESKELGVSPHKHLVNTNHKAVYSHTQNKSIFMHKDEKNSSTGFRLALDGS